ncbi:MAG: DUF2937 family protein [Marivibrio sp.]|uniref:DUF2937 family protein n=1 Tax=Marivibrio sp. TaxID=2039719 RepID=UPI0032EF1C77
MKRTLLTAFALIVALLASQVPEFRQQYLQRLGGALDEVTRQVAALDERAQAAGLERYAYLRRLLGNPDPIVVREGEALLDLVSRKRRLETAIARIEDAPAYLHVVQIVLNLEPEVASAALEDYVPAAPLSLSGLFHAFVGFFVGYLAPMGVRRLFPRRVRAEG